MFPNLYHNYHLVHFLVHILQKEYRIQQIDVLDDIRDKLSNSLYLKWDYESLKEDQINDLEKLMGKYKGKKQIIFELLDSESSTYVTLNSRKFMSNVSNELIHEISQLDGFLGYSINKSNMVNYLEKNNP